MDAIDALVKAGPYIGPKGGKWADPGHSIPWDEKKHAGKESKHHEVSIRSGERSRGRGGTVTRWHIHDPAIPGPNTSRVHTYETTGASPAERRQKALEEHARKHGIEKPIKHVDFDKRRRKHSLKQMPKEPAAKGRVRVASRDGHREIPAHASHGNYHVHDADTERAGEGKPRPQGEEYAVTHGPTGMRLRTFGSKKMATDYARHMHKQAGDAMSDAKFGEQPKGEGLAKVRDAHNAFMSSWRKSAADIEPLFKSQHALDLTGKKTEGGKKKAVHPVSEAQRRWAFAAEERGELPEGTARKWSRRGIQGKADEAMYGKAIMLGMPGRSRSGTEAETVGPSMTELEDSYMRIYGYTREAAGMKSLDPIDALQPLVKGAQRGGKYKYRKWTPSGWTYVYEDRGPKNPKQAKEHAKYEEAQEKHDTHNTRELDLHADNTRQLYNQKESIHRNLINKMAAGKYDHHEARKLWQYHADAAAKHYEKEQRAGVPGKLFSVHDRRKMAHDNAEQFLAEHDSGEHDHHLQKQYSTKGHDKPPYVKKSDIDAIDALDVLAKAGKYVRRRRRGDRWEYDYGHGWGVTDKRARTNRSAEVARHFSDGQIDLGESSKFARKFLKPMPRETAQFFEHQPGGTGKKLPKMGTGKTPTRRAAALAQLVNATSPRTLAMGTGKTRKSESFVQHGDTMLRKGLYSFDLSGRSNTQALPENLLYEYLCAFIEEACEHERHEPEHRNPTAGEDIYAARAMPVMHELVQYVPKNPNLKRAVQKFKVTTEVIAEIMKQKGFVKPPTDGHHDHGDYWSHDYDSAQAMGAGMPRGPAAESLMASVTARPDASRPLTLTGRGPRMVRYQDDDRTVGPVEQLHKSRVRAHYADDGNMRVVSSACIIHGSRDLTKEQNFATPYAECRCGE